MSILQICMYRGSHKFTPERTALPVIKIPFVSGYALCGSWLFGAIGALFRAHRATEKWVVTFIVDRNSCEQQRKHGSDKLENRSLSWKIHLCLRLTNSDLIFNAKSQMCVMGERETEQEWDEWLGLAGVGADSWGPSLLKETIDNIAHGKTNHCLSVIYLMFLSRWNEWGGNVENTYGDEKIDESNSWTTCQWQQSCAAHFQKNETIIIIQRDLLAKQS